MNNPEDKTDVVTNSETVTADQTVAPEDNGSSTPLSMTTLAAAHLGEHPGFDPTLHAANPDGTPKRKADGSYAMKRGRKAGSTANPLPPKTGSAPASVAPTPEVVTAPRIAPDEAARQSANLVINAAVWICGEEIGRPQDKAEADGLKISFVNYYEARGVPNIPPEIGLIAALASYIVPRFRQSEKARGLIERGVIWFRSKIGK